MRKLIFASLLLVLLVPVSVFAQEPLRVKTVTLQFWPEYDQPNVLVIQSVELTEDTPLPVEVSVKLPAYVGAPNAVAVLIENELLNADFSSNVEGEWLIVTLISDSRFIHIEYYDTELLVADKLKSYSYLFESDYDISFLDFIVQQPPRATEMQVSLPLVDSYTQNNLNYYLSSFQDVPAGTSQEISFNYQKADDSLTVDMVATQTVEDSKPTRTISIWDQIDMQVLLIILAVGLIAFGVYNSLKKPNTRSRPTSRRSSTRNAKQTKPKKQQSSYCHQCGSEIWLADKFCRNCGTKRRS